MSFIKSILLSFTIFILRWCNYTMKKYRTYSLLSLIIPTLSLAQSAAPTISNTTPATALACDVVTINGTNFTQSSSIIWDGSITISPTSWTSTSLAFKTPGTLMAGGTYGVHDLFVRNSTSDESNHTSLTTNSEPQTGVGGFGGYTTHVMRDVCVTFQEFDNVVAQKMKGLKVNWNTVNPSALSEFSKPTRNINGAMTDQVDALKQKLFFGTTPLSNDEKAYLRLTIGGGGNYVGTFDPSSGSYTYSWRANYNLPLGDPSNDETTWNGNITTPPLAPTLSVAAVDCGAGLFNVTWTRQNGATKYNLWRAVGGEASEFYSDAYTSMTTENGMTGGQTYKYKVQAENSFGKSPFSNEITYVFPVECAKAEPVTAPSQPPVSVTAPPQPPVSITAPPQPPVSVTAPPQPPVSVTAPPPLDLVKARALRKPLSPEKLKEAAVKALQVINNPDSVTTSTTNNEAVTSPTNSGLSISKRTSKGSALSGSTAPTFSTGTNMTPTLVNTQSPSSTTGPTVGQAGVPTVTGTAANVSSASLQMGTAAFFQDLKQKMGKASSIEEKKALEKTATANAVKHFGRFDDVPQSFFKQMNEIKNDVDTKSPMREGLNAKPAAARSQ